MILEQLVEPAATTIVSLNEAKAQLRVDHADEDAAILALVTAAGQAIEAMTGRALLTQDWRQAQPPVAGAARVRLLRTPVQSLVGLSCLDAAGAEEVVDPAGFRLVGADAAWWVEPIEGNAWPVAPARADGLRVTYRAGYGSTSADVPGTLRTAALMLVAHWYEHRVAVAQGAMGEVPLGVQHLVGLHRVGWMAA